MLTLEIRRDVPLAPFTTLEVGGAARYFAAVHDVAQLHEALAWAQRHAAATVILGGGSNVVVADAGFDGLVIRQMAAALHLDRAQHRLVADAGCSWDRLVEVAVDAGLGGLECLSGIPGEAGASPIQNIGAYGQELADCLQAVHVVERQPPFARRAIAVADCKLGYRASRFRAAGAQAEVIVGIELQLLPGLPALPRHEALRRRLSVRQAAPDVSHIRQAVLALRREKSMLYDRLDPNARSVGSFFMNPCVDRAQAMDLARRTKDMPQYPAPQGTKLSAAWLIEQAGSTRGLVRGAVGLSSRHALAIINRGGARAVDVLRLAGDIRAQVMAQFNVLLQIEPVLLGFDSATLADCGLADLS